VFFISDSIEASHLAFKLSIGLSIIQFVLNIDNQPIELSIRRGPSHGGLPGRPALFHLGLGVSCPGPICVSPTKGEEMLQIWKLWTRFLAIAKQFAGCVT
jgi:hypothetical protein